MGLELKETFYMDTEADVEWDPVDGATYYILMVREFNKFRVRVIDVCLKST